MQDIHSIGSGGGGVGRLFAGGDRRLRPHHGQIPPTMKCPRCESINTKFCYYNNYNLSQPRHFCKSCRRYWTKGGVLRNVPVGGGCRKAKRSKPKANSSDDVTPKEQKSSNSQNSSSESSSLTATTTATAAVTTPTTADAVVVAATAKSKRSSSDNSASTLLNFHDSRFLSIPESTNANPSFDPPLMDQSPESGMFPEIGSFTGLMTSSNNVPRPLNFNTVPMLIGNSADQQWHGQQTEVRMQELGGGYMDQTAQMELSELQNRRNDCGLAAVDWESGGDEGLFDLTGTVDQSYWNQTQWPDHDHHLNYLP